MEPHHARYPFFEAARRAVRERDASLPDLVAGDDPAVERGRDRVERALVEGVTDPTDPADWSTRAELLSYPVARVLISLLGADAAVQKYAAAEAATARERYREDVASDEPELASTPSDSVDLDDLLREFDLAGDVRAGAADGPGPGSFQVAVGRYLSLSDPGWGAEWRLVRRQLHDGEVRVERDELFALLGEATRRRVAAGLPFDVDPEGELATALEPQVASLRELLDERERVAEVDAVVPELFPSCIETLHERAREDVLTPPESFALVSFLAASGLDVEEVPAFLADSTLPPEQVRYQAARICDERGAQYPPPSCETLAGYGVCENEDGHRDDASGPIAAYRDRLAAADGYVDWRDREERERAT